MGWDWLATLSLSLMTYCAGGLSVLLLVSRGRERAIRRRWEALNARDHGAHPGGRR